MARRMHDDEPGRDCETPGTVMPSQLSGLTAAFAMKGIERSGQGQYVYDALAYRGMRWRHGGQLGRLSCHQAGLVLHALHFGPGVPHEH